VRKVLDDAKMRVWVGTMQDKVLFIYERFLCRDERRPVQRKPLRLSSGT